MSSAVLQRSRRSTAGKRLGTLVGKAQEDDDLFWSHAIWSERGGGFAKSRSNGDDDEGSTASAGDDQEESDGEASYRISEDDSQAAVDQFDSDFNESEDSSDEEEDAEAALREEERREKRNGMTAGRELIRRKVGKRAKLVSQGLNAGLVLNWFTQDGVSAASAAAAASAVSSSSSAALSAVGDSAPSAADALSEVAATPLVQTIHSAEPTATATAGSALTFSPSIQSATSSSVAPHPSQIDSLRTKSPMQSQGTTQQIISVQTTSDLIPSTERTITSTATTKTPQSPSSPSRKRNLRAGTLYKTIAAVQQHQQSSQKLLAKQRSTPASQRNPSKRQYTQEEMILEAVQCTEVENHKWLIRRKRRKEAMKEEENDALMKNGKARGGGRLIERFHSKRGGCNTFTFYDMDRLPDIFTRGTISHVNNGGGAGASSMVGMYSPRRRNRSNSEGSGGKHSSSSENGSSSSRNIGPKCVITGKVARYRDPKTMLGYHDVDAYKELRRRVDAGELRPALSHARASKFNEKRHFPFSKDKPTMVATLDKSASDVKVMVTLNDVPVSPPIESKPNVLVLNDKWMGLPVGVPMKRGPPLPEDFLNDGLMEADSKVVGTQETDSKVVVMKETNSKVGKPNTYTSAAPESTDGPIVINNGGNHCSNTADNVSMRLSPRTLKPTPKMSPDTPLSSNLLPTDSNVAILHNISSKSNKNVDKSNDAAIPNLSNTPPVTISGAKTTAVILPRVSPRKHKPTSKMLPDSPLSSNGNNGTSKRSKDSNSTNATAGSLQNSNGSATNKIDLTSNKTDPRNGNSDRTHLSNSKKIIA